jgi:hypothetical protein
VTERISLRKYLSVAFWTWFAYRLPQDVVEVCAIRYLAKLAEQQKALAHWAEQTEVSTREKTQG